jgi:hypothetical protein
MSKGLGAVQRAVLDALRTNDADPMADFQVCPFYQSWSPLDELWRAAACHAESARRALRLLGPAVVETRLLHPVTWRHPWFSPVDDCDTAARSLPGACRRMIRRYGPESRRMEQVEVWMWPTRNRGTPRLHARLALSEEDRLRYRAAEYQQLDAAIWDWSDRYREWADGRPFGLRTPS